MKVNLLRGIPGSTPTTVAKIELDALPMPGEYLNHNGQMWGVVARAFSLTEEDGFEVALIVKKEGGLELAPAIVNPSPPPPDRHGIVKRF